MENECWRAGVRFAYNGEYEKSSINFKTLLSRVAPSAHKIRARLLFNLSVVAGAQNNYDKAIKYLSKAIKSDKLAILYFQRGVFYHTSGNLSEASIDYSEALRMFDKDEQEISFLEYRLGFTLYRSNILYNRSLAFCGLKLFHRARDDLITSIPVTYNKNDLEKTKQLLELVQTELLKPSTKLLS